MRNRSGMIALLLVCGPSSAWAAEPSGCDKFKWPIDRDRAALTSAKSVTVDSGTTVPLKGSVAVSITLTPIDAAKLPQKPERAPAPDTYAGSFTIDALPKGVYSISLAEASWIDAIQDGRYLKPIAHSGVTGCDGVRKIVRFEVAAQPLLLQFTGVASRSLAVAVLPVTE